MAPRSYTLGRRAETSLATRQQILDAAVEVYREVGVTNATIRAIAARADVSRGTVLHHFDDAAGLLAAVLDTALAGLSLPDGSVLDGATDPPERARRFVAEMFRFYDRTSEWWRVFAGDGNELPSHPAFREATRQYEAGVSRFEAAALGPLAQDRVVAITVATLIAPTTFYPLLGAGLTLAETIDVVGDLVADLVTRRIEAGTAGTKPPRRQPQARPREAQA